MGVKRQFGLDDAYLDDLKVELIDAQHGARREREHSGLDRCRGDTAIPAAPFHPARTPESRRGLSLEERVSEKALDVAYDHTRSTTAFLTLFMSIPDWRMHGA
jgi:hypothetical protein